MPEPNIDPAWLRRTVHDLNNELTLVLGVAQLRRLRLKEPGGVEDWRTVEQAALAIRRLLKGVLEALNAADEEMTR